MGRYYSHGEEFFFTSVVLGTVRRTSRPTRGTCRPPDMDGVVLPPLALAGGLLASLTVMGSSRKMFGSEVVARYLVPHRADIGFATFFNIGFSVAIGIGLLDSSFGPGGQLHGYSATIVQLGYLQSLIDRRDFHRLLILLPVGLALALAVLNEWSVATASIEVLSLWAVKLILPPRAQAVAARVKPKGKGKAKAAASIKGSGAEVDDGVGEADATEVWTGEAPGDAKAEARLRHSAPKKKAKTMPTRRRSRSM